MSAGHHVEKLDRRAVRTRRRLAGGALVLALAVVTSCGHGNSGFTGAPPRDAGGARREAGPSDTGLPGLSDATLDACRPTSCSRDLHSILDCDGHVVATCPDDQGCSPDGTCIPACKSAESLQTSIGCEYYAVQPDTISFDGGEGNCFAAYLVNTWSSPVTLKADRAGVSLDLSKSAYIPTGSGAGITYQPLPSGQLPPGQVAIVFLSDFKPTVPRINCPADVEAAFTSALGSVVGTDRGNAFHLTTDRPVVAYDIYPYGGGAAAATSATLLLPTSVWGTNYLAVDAFRKSEGGGGGVGPDGGVTCDGNPDAGGTGCEFCQPSFDIVASQDATTVTVKPSADIVGSSTVAGTSKGQPQEYTLDKGQILQFTQPVELTGSVIGSDKPIAVWGAATLLNIDVASAAGDSAHQQLPPIQAMGHEYVAVRYPNRTTIDEAPPWRVVGTVAGTTLTYDPAPPTGAPTTLDVGQVAEFWNSGPFVVRSQDADHPFYMSGHMTGGCDYGGAGDPEFVNVVPPQQYLSSYLFFTDPTYSETHLVVVRTKGSGGFQDVSLDCAGTLGGWFPVGTGGVYEYTYADLVTGDFEPVGKCTNGTHTMSSGGPFGVTVWGWGSPAARSFNTTYVSYAYPAGMWVQSINTVKVPVIK
jgi:hypothetical protein